MTGNTAILCLPNGNEYPNYFTGQESQLRPFLLCAIRYFHNIFRFVKVC